MLVYVLPDQTAYHTCICYMLILSPIANMEVNIKLINQLYLCRSYSPYYQEPSLKCLLKAQQVLYLYLCLFCAAWWKTDWLFPWSWKFEMQKITIGVKITSRRNHIQTDRCIYRWVVTHHNALARSTSSSFTHMIWRMVLTLSSAV